jgi:F-type H+-transporting ATPase subunit gamma
LQHKISGAEDLLSVVTTMKSLAAVSIRQYERAVTALAEYNRSIEMGLQVVLQHGGDGAQLRARAAVPSIEPDAPCGVVVFGSDQGLCGQFNERIVAHALETLNGMHVRKQRRRIVAVGVRCAGLLEDAGQPTPRLFAVPSGLAGVTELVQNLLLTIDDWRVAEQVGPILLFHNRPLGGAEYRPAMVQLLPLDPRWLRAVSERPWHGLSLPTFSMEWNALFSALIQQHMFVVLHRACTESMASEEASRLAAMQNAEHNIEERLAELSNQYHQQRQSAITAELLDIIAGYAAVTQEEEDDAMP